MRSKEVEKAIKSMTNFVNQKYYNGVTSEEMKIVLSYITKIENKLEEKEHIIKKLNLESQKYFDMLMEVEYERDTISKRKIRDKIKELEQTKGDFATYIAVSERIQVLKELLGDEK